MEDKIDVVDAMFDLKWTPISKLCMLGRGSKN